MKIAPRTIGGILISNVSFPKILEEKIAIKSENSELILPYLIKSIIQLEKAGADFIVLPCNTLHTLLPQLKQISKIPILDLIEEASKEILKNYSKIGILSTAKTRNEKLYDNKLENRVSIIYPTTYEQNIISRIILKIIRKKSEIRDKKFLEKVILKLKKKGAQKVLLACTDLANLIRDSHIIIDSTELLIQSIIRNISDY